ncbi:MAG: O-antigen ligase family protein [Elusimicrobiota bacterium]|nr:O-antigen ligase family protein [Elusimicrobiota bacterium]
MSGSVPSAALEGLLYLLLAFGPFAFGCVEPWARATLEAACFLLAFGVFLRGRAAASPAGTFLWTLPAAFAALALLQAANAPLPDGPRPAWPFSVSPAETEDAARLWAAYACLAWSVPRVLIDHDAARRFARVFLGLGVAVAALGFAQAWTSVDRIYWTRPTAKGVAPFGPYYNMDHAAGFLLLSLGFGSGLFASRFSEWNEGRPTREWGRAQAAMAALLALVFAALTACRSQAAMLALALGALFVVFLAAGFHERRRRLLQAGGALAAAAAVVALVFRVATAGEAAGAVVEKAVRSRLAIYADAWRWWLDAPWTGTGLGTFDFLYPAYQDSSLRAAVSHAHSDWIETALGAGLPGLLLAAAAALLPAAAGARSWWSGRSREMRGLLGGALAAGAFAAAHSLFEFNFQIPGNAVAMVAVAGFLASSASWRDKRVERPFPDRPDALGVSLAGVALVVGVAWAAAPAVARARLAPQAAPAARAAGASRALALDEDPRHWYALGAASHDLAMSSPEPDPALLRFAASAAVTAADARPYDSAPLYLAGVALWRLQRPQDAADFFAASRAVGFAPYRPPRGARAAARRAAPSAGVKP